MEDSRSPAPAVCWVLEDAKFPIRAKKSTLFGSGHQASLVVQSQMATPRGGFMGGHPRRRGIPMNPERSGPRSSNLHSWPKPAG